MLAKVWSGWLICSDEDLATLRITTNLTIMRTIQTVNKDVSEYQVEIEDKYMDVLDSHWGNAIWGLEVK